MTISMLIRTLFEVLMFVAVVWGIFHEDKLVAFEHHVIACFKRRKFKVVKSEYNYKARI